MSPIDPTLILTDFFDQAITGDEIRDQIDQDILKNIAKDASTTENKVDNSK